MCYKRIKDIDLVHWFKYWQRESFRESDVVAKCYYAKQKLVWEVMEHGLESKIEIQWSDISAIRATFSDNPPDILEIETTGDERRGEQTNGDDGRKQGRRGEARRQQGDREGRREAGGQRFGTVGTPGRVTEGRKKGARRGDGKDDGEGRKGEQGTTARGERGSGLP
ncbi:hypothetical protein ACLOJK_017640 [Asimina triloba]